MKQMVEVEIDGQVCRLASPYDEAYTRRIADYLNAKLDALRTASRRPSTQQSLMLVAFDVIDELFQAKELGEREREAANREKQAVEKELRELLAELDGRLAAPKAPTRRGKPKSGELF